MLRVEVDVVLGRGPLLGAHHLHELADLRRLVVHQHDGRGGQPVRRLHDAHAAEEALRHELGERRALGLAEGGLHDGVLLVAVGLLARLDGAVERRVERLDVLQLVLAVVLEVLHDELVDLLREDDHLEAVLAVLLEVGRRHGDVLRGGRDVVDARLARRHAVDVGVEGVQRARAVGGRLEAQQLGDVRLVHLVSADALLEEVPELLDELLVLRRVLARLLVEPLEDALRHDGAQLADERAVLRVLAGDVQREVLAVDRALQEAQPLGEDVLRLRLDEDLPAVQVDGALLAPAAELLGVRLRDVQQRVDHERRVDGVVQVAHRRVVGAADELVERGVLLRRDLVLRLPPERLHRVHGGAVQRDLERDEVGVLLDDALDDLRRAKRELGVLHLEHDLRPRRDARALHDLVGPVPVGLPEVPSGARRGAPRVDLDVLRHHKGAVEADAELPDDVLHRLRALALLLEPVQEGLRARAADGAEAVDELLLAHPDAGVGEDELALRLVHDDRHAGLGVVRAARVFRGVGELHVAALLQGVRGVADELADENFLVGVQAARDDVEQLAGFRLEGHLVRRAGDLLRLDNLRLRLLALDRVDDRIEVSVVLRGVVGNISCGLAGCGGLRLWLLRFRCIRLSLGVGWCLLRALCVALVPSCRGVHGRVGVGGRVRSHPLRGVGH